MCDEDILNLPDEVKLKIFEYLDGVSKLELSKVCRDFARLCQDKQLLQRLNFYHNYRTRLVHFKLRASTPLYRFVTHLNISSVYWIPSAQLRYILLKFIELNYLNVTDTQLTFRDLKTVLTATTKVHKLAISLKTDHCSDVMFLKLDNDITHFYVTYSSFSLRALVNVLTNFDELEELWIIEPKVPGIVITPEVPWSQFTERSLPKVKKRFVLTKRTNILSEGTSLVEQVRTPGNWIELLTHRVPVFIVTGRLGTETIGDFLEKFPEGQELKGFNPQNKMEEKLAYLSREAGFTSMFRAEDLKELINKKCSYSDCYFRYINLSKSSETTPNDKLPDYDRCSDAFEYVLFARNMSKLNKLKLGSLFLHNKKSAADSVYLPLFKKPRIGSGAGKVTDRCLFARLTNHLAEVEDVEIVNDFENLRLSKCEWQPDSLKFITNWKRLRKLTLTSIPFHNGKFIVEITKNCPYLISLKIKDKEVQDKISYDVCNALRYAKNLHDFRYERNGCAPMDELFEALTNCLELERLYMQCRTTKSISKRPLETLLSVCENLVFFFVYITELLETVCKTIKQSMSHYDIKPIQIFTIRGRAYNINNITYDDIPSVHIREMVCQSNDHSEYLDSF